eukprot:gnl/MRDRNA2_/MRDRNA2_276622_c0_seq1.p1 gnl/MRDRNA2_/MRDRNA2_276622_c0~~gnl/MRDRNA2_/MRDRNA2_276622_c0_seq1.p1  ORF type:complete len:107 (-),score=1.59 gnl/MRDRNA2_/MRDRNA2_276622_c0_seq1:6-326(-)
MCSVLANAHVTWARSCIVIYSMLSFAARANTLNSAACQYPIVANAHAVMATSQLLKSFTRYSVAIASTFNSCTAGWHTVANAHAVLARPTLLLLLGFSAQSSPKPY